LLEEKERFVVEVNRPDLVLFSLGSVQTGSSIRYGICRGQRTRVWRNVTASLTISINAPIGDSTKMQLKEGKEEEEQQQDVREKKNSFS
jgi:hypothetical protein